MNKTKTVKIATLNTRSILGAQKKQQSKQLCTYLKSKNSAVDILCLQDISASHSNFTVIDSDITALQHLFPNCEAIWEKRTAIIALNPQYKLTHSCITPDGRGIITDVLLSNSSTFICKIANIYAPANSQDRLIFYHKLLHLLTKPGISKQNTIIVGDFNLHINQRQ